jgi:hypothetical protein
MNQWCEKVIRHLLNVSLALALSLPAITAWSAGSLGGSAVGSQGASMEIKDWMSIAAAFISLTALIVSLRNRKADIAREEAYLIRSRVWEILNGEPGFRTVSALDEADDKTDQRIKLLRRTAAQLKLAGAFSLGCQLDNLLDGAWPKADEKTQRAREDFCKAATDFMQPT